MFEKENGFTLTETLIATAVVSVLAAIALPSYNYYVKSSQVSEAFRLMQVERANLDAIHRTGSCNITAGQPDALKGKYGVLTISGTYSPSAGASCPTGCNMTYKLNTTGVDKELEGKTISAQILNNGKLSKIAGSTSIPEKFLPNDFRTVGVDAGDVCTKVADDPLVPTTGTYPTGTDTGAPPPPPPTPPTPPVTPPPPPVTPPAPSPTGTEVPITVNANSHRLLVRSKVPGDGRITEEYSLPGVMLRIGNRPNDLNGGPDIGYDYGITLQYPKGVDPTKIEGVDVNIKFQSGQAFNFSLRGFEVPKDGYNYLDAKNLALFRTQEIFNSLTYMVRASSDCAEVIAQGRCYQDVLLQDKLNKNYILPALNPLADFVEGVLTADVTEIDPIKGYVYVTTLPSSKAAATTTLTYHMKK